MKAWLVPLACLLLPARLAAQPMVLSATSAAAWTQTDYSGTTGTPPVPVVSAFQGRLYLQTAVTGSGEPATPPVSTFDWGKPPLGADGLVHSPPLKPLVAPNTAYVLFVHAIGPGGTSPASNASPGFMATVVAPPVCGGGGQTLTIAVQSYTPTVKMGDQGSVSFRILTASNPVTVTQVRFETQVVGQQLGEDLRATSGMYFSVPRVAGTYNLFVYAKDAQNCEALTTLARAVTVQP